MQVEVLAVIISGILVVVASTMLVTKRRRSATVVSTDNGPSEQTIGSEQDQTIALPVNAETVASLEPEVEPMNNAVVQDDTRKETHERKETCALVQKHETIVIPANVENRNSHHHSHHHHHHH